MFKSNKPKTVNFTDAGQTFLMQVARPTFLYDKTSKTRLKYGEYEDVVKAYELMKETYLLNGFNEMADDLAVVEVEPDQEKIDRLFQSSGVFSQFVDSIDTSGIAH